MNIERSNIARIDAIRDVDYLTGSSEGGWSSSLNLKDYLRILKRNKWGILLFALLGTIVGWLVVSSETPLYNATATIIIEPEKSNLASIDSIVLAYSSWRYYETQYRVLTSREIAKRIVSDLDLVNRKPRKTTHPTLQFPIIGKSKAFLADAKNWLAELKNAILPTTSVGVSDAVETGATSPESGNDSSGYENIVSSIQSGLQVSGGDKSQIVSVSFISADPEYARDVVNTAAIAYIELGREQRLQRTRQAGSWLTQQIEKVQGRLRASEERLQAFQAEEGLISLDRLESLQSDRLGSINDEYLRAQAKFNELSERYGPKHPKIVEARADLAISKSRLERESNRVVSTRDTEFELGQLERDVETNRELYELFLNRFNETDLANDTELSNSRVLDTARTPRRPFSPNIERTISIWAIIGLVVGVCIAFLREHLDNTFRTHEQVEQILRVPVLGILPFVTGSFAARKSKGRDRKSGIESSDGRPERHYITENRSVFTESVNQIRTGILFSNVDNPPKSILVTSAIQSEGKTTLSTNLALSFSQLGRTLLIDADLRKPRVATATGIDAMSHGLVEYVAGLSSLQDCVVQDRDSPNLFILRSGSPPPNPLELLSSNRLKRSLEQFKTQFEHIIIDTAPLLPVSDAIVLGHVVDSTIMVVQANKTTHSLASEGLKRIRSASLHPLGIVLTQLRQNRAAYYYNDSYYSAYYGGKYYGQAHSA